LKAAAEAVGATNMIAATSGARIMPVMAPARHRNPSLPLARAPLRLRRALVLLAVSSLVGCRGPSPRQEERHVEILADRMSSGYDLAVDADEVYWFDGSGNGKPPQIRKVSRRGGPSVVLAELIDSGRLEKHSRMPRMALVEDGVLYASGDTKDCEPRSPCPMSLMLAPKTPGAAPRVIDHGDRLRWLAGRGGVWIATPTETWNALPSGYRKAGSTTTVAVPALPAPSGPSALAVAAPAEGESVQRWEYKAGVADTSAIRLLYGTSVERGGTAESDLVSVEVPLDGSAPAARHHRISKTVSDCILDGADTYCLLPDAIIKVGQAITVVAKKSVTIEKARIGCDESYVYFVGYSDETTPFGHDSRGHYAVYRVRKSGGQVERMVKLPRVGYSVESIAVDHDSIYVRGESQLVRLAK
jgi:hypothetical protein